ncbi:MAG TPA: hypothetical protein GXX63_02145 [Tissierellia bacterium]|nr:hypothetical protein [Tissierellia bacterium]
METIAKRLNIKTTEDYTRFYEKTKEYCDAIDKKVAELQVLSKEKSEVCKENLNDIDFYIDYEAVTSAISGLLDNKIHMLEMLNAVAEEFKEEQ